MHAEHGPYGRLERILERVDFAWRVSGSLLDYIAEHGIWTRRFRPGGPHALWIGGHLALYDAAALKLYAGLDRNPLEEWREPFGKGSECFDDPSRYPDGARILGELKRAREAAREAIAGMSDADLDRTVPFNERLRIRDVQSQIEFAVWHDSHHAAQLGAIVNNYKAERAD